MEKYNSRSEVPEKYKWNLTDFFKDEKDYEKKFNDFKNEIKKAKEYVGCTKDSGKLYEFLDYFMKTNSDGENLFVYSYLKNDEELGNSKSIDRLSKIQNLCEEFSNMISFFEPELLKLSKEEYKELFNNKKLDEYKSFLDEIYREKDHILSENEEIIISQLNNAMNNFEEISSNLLNNEHNYGSVIIDGVETEIHSTNYGKILKNKDVNIRKEAFNKYKTVLAQYAGTSASLLDSYVKANNTNAKIHKFKNAWDRKLFDYEMKEEAYNALTNTISNNLDVLHKYYGLYKDVYNLKEVHMYDLNLDLANSDKKYSIEEATSLIREALKPLGEEYLKCYDRIIENHYIDFCEYKGKCSGGYSASTSTLDSRILLSFNEYLSSVSVIAHECGHNVHHQFVKANNKIQYRDITNLVAEVVSLTNECLLSHYLSINGKTKEEKLSGIVNILEVFDANLFGATREGMMESDFNKYSEDGNAITKDYMNELDEKYIRMFYGNDIVYDKYFNTTWIRRSHFYMNYYLYNYAFCISVASSVASRIIKGDKDMLNKYLKFIKLGSDTKPLDAFKVLGADLTKEDVYKDAINYFDSLVEKFKQISKE